jgi:hypothetical protein
MPRLLASFVVATLCGSLQTDISTLKSLALSYGTADACAPDDVPCMHLTAYVTSLEEAALFAQSYSRILECADAPAPSSPMAPLADPTV